MKRQLLLLTVAMSLSQWSIAQSNEWLPMLEEGRVWHVVSLHFEDSEKATYKDLHGNPCFGIPYTYRVEGEQSSDGQTYKKVIQEGYDAITLFRQQGPRVYMHDWDGGEMLVYDFSLNVGDLFCVDKDVDWYLRVIKKESVNIDGVERRCLWMQMYGENEIPADDMPDDIWVEGIGGVVTSPGFVYSLWSTMGTSALEDCCQEDEVVFSSSDLEKLSPFVSSIDFISYEKRHSSVLYDLQGRRLVHEPLRGIYIKDGRKVVK